MEFRTDERGVSNLVGTMILVAFLIITLSLYQAQAVPAQNGEVEFKHNLRVQTDLLDVRNAILQSKETGTSAHVTIEMGTSYPTRVITINPPAPAGHIRTTDEKPLKVFDESGSEISTDVCPGDSVTRLFVYEPNYHAYHNAPTTVYEHSVLYNQFESANVPLSGQTLVVGDTINLIPLRSQYSLATSQPIVFDARAGKLKSSSVTNATVVLPTQLTEDNWETLLDGQVDPANIDVADNKLTLTPEGEYTINCGPVGVNAVPPSGARESSNVKINPVGPGDVELRDTRISGTGSQDKTVEIDLNNTADTDVTVERARISFFFDGNKKSAIPSEADIRATLGGNSSATLPVKGDTQTLSPKITLSGNETSTTVYLEFDKEVTDADFFIIQLTYENGKEGTYFVTPNK